MKKHPSVYAQKRKKIESRLIRLMIGLLFVFAAFIAGFLDPSHKDNFFADHFLCYFCTSACSVQSLHTFSHVSFLFSCFLYYKNCCNYPTVCHPAMLLNSYELLHSVFKEFYKLCIAFCCHLIFLEFLILLHNRNIDLCSGITLFLSLFQNRQHLVCRHILLDKICFLTILCRDFIISLKKKHYDSLESN